MDTNYAEPDGRLGRKGYAYLLERARGGVGLIIVEASSIDWPHGKISVRQYRMDSHEITPEWFDLIESVHSFGTKIICQLHHGGCVANPAFSGGAESIAPSKTGGEGSFFPSAREMTKDDIERLIEQHVQAAEQAKKCGFDGVEVHAAHCYIINQFLSPIINHRTDEYGGSLENRMRILQRVVRGIREACGDSFLLSVRLACEDSIPGGITLEEGKSIAKACEESGADLINCSTGFYASVATANETQYDQEGPRLRLSRAIKPVLQTAKVAVVGKLRTPDFCDRA
jgi:2,4-dienoyl-CoA reductase-like NADH-dependent reductase (Old Yellow Enzyme family)